LIRGIIFDLGMTLLHFDGDWNEVLEESWQSLADYLLDKGYEIEVGEFINAFRKLYESRYYERTVDHIEQPTTELFRQVIAQFGYDEFESSEIEKALDQFYVISEAYWSSRDIVTSVLDDLEALGYRMALISNAGDTPNVKRLLEKGQLTEYFNPILISAGEGIRKPHVGLYQKVLQAWSFDPEEVVMVGDSLKEDILGAQKAGIHQIWMKEHVDTPQNHELSMQIQPEAVAGRFQEIPGIILKISGEDPVNTHV
jgi:putative hydrolase of the HAD superfamily